MSGRGFGQFENELAAMHFANRAKANFEGFNVYVTGDESARRKLAQLELHFEDLRGLWPMLVPIVGGWMKSQFESQGIWGGAHWAALSPAYAAEKARTHPGRSILIRDGGLRRAASQMRREATPRTLTLWVDDPVAAYHQEGNERLPARPLIPTPLPQAALRDVELAGHEYVSTLIRQIGL